MTICSLVVQAKPQYVDAVVESLNTMEGVEIHAHDEYGKMVVSIDHPSREYCSKAMTEMTYLNGVMSTSLVFEYQEDLDLDQTNITQNQTHQMKGDAE
ncbi:MAG TPA: hypothetical protein ENG92_04100 [Thiolapillus brandeum]|uniref:Chaperone NapD n=1 Tax=Thiolapillus brandeum TaxID=1076588 RepID=A0A831KC94_9GAMM|nr:hypothetical protein [Thiolapillus brandeum]